MGAIVQEVVKWLTKATHPQKRVLEILLCFLIITLNCLRHLNVRQTFVTLNNLF
jgi:hypothetical protein